MAATVIYSVFETELSHKSEFKLRKWTTPLDFSLSLADDRFLNFKSGDVQPRVRVNINKSDMLHVRALGYNLILSGLP